VAGRRERKKSKTRAAIARAARALMVRRGFEATTMESVAERADVSVGTLYNHFASKRALLLGIMADATGDVVARAAAVVEDPGEDAHAAVLRLMHVYAESLQRLDKGLLRRALGISFTDSAEVGAEMLRLDELLVEQTAALVGKLQARGSIATEIPAPQAALALYGSFAIAMVLWMAMPDADDTALFTTLDQQLAVLFLGLAPRPKQERWTR
jgi:AcrR family transcriptional regulator